MRKARVLFLFLSVQFFLYNMGLLGRRLSLLASAVSLIVFLALSMPGRDNLCRRMSLVPAAALVLLLAVISRGSAEEVFAFPLLLAALLLLPPRKDHRWGERETLLLACFLFSTVVLLRYHVPILWHVLQGWGLLFSKGAGKLIGQSYLLGPTAAGVPIFLLFLSYMAAGALLGEKGRLRHLLKSVSLMIVIHAAVLILLTPIAILIQQKAPGWELLLFNPEGLIFAALSLVLLIGLPEAGRAARSVRRRWYLVLIPAALLASLFMTLRPGPGSAGGKILVYDQGYLNWKVPVYGFYGEKSGGMFGYLPKFLEGAGYDVEVVDELNRGNLAGADAVIVINVLKYFSGTEKAAVEDFVRAGGGLLTLGDHTGIKGIRGTFNDLLSPFGIEFLFDSATFQSKGWGEEAVLMPHPVTHGLFSAEEMEIWVGASLGVKPEARPVVVARYGYSDVGNIMAVERAYLGNRRYDPGEQLGDLVLVAAREYGKGRVLVFGDTSPFQNTAMVTSHCFVTRVASWMVSGGSAGWARSFALPLLLAAAAAAVLALGNAALAGFVSLSILLGSMIGLVPGKMGEYVPLRMRTAIIDLSHFERFDRLTWYDDCIGGLKLNLMRAGYFPLLKQRFSERQIMDSRIFAVIAPVRPFTEDETAILDSYMLGGGWILYSCGSEEKEGSRRFLERYGLKLLDLPLTSFADTLMDFRVDVKEGWGVEVTGPKAEILGQRFGFPYLVRIGRGRGGMIFVADSYFFLNRNLEGMKEYFPGNVEFLKRLLDEIGGKGPVGGGSSGAVKPEVGR